MEENPHMQSIRCETFRSISITLKSVICISWTKVISQLEPTWFAKLIIESKIMLDRKTSSYSSGTNSKV